MLNKILCKPNKERLKESLLFDFCDYCNQPQSMEALYDWSLRDNHIFWSKVWDYFKIIGTKGIINPIKASNSFETFIGTKFFPEAKLNFAKNLLRASCNIESYDKTAIEFFLEDSQKEKITYQQLASEVLKVRKILLSIGIKPNDVIAAVIPNCPLAIIGMLATSSIGAIWTSCSPDFGSQGIIDRFEQTEPKILFTVDGYYYKRKFIDIRDKVNEAITKIPSIKNVIYQTFEKLNYDLTNYSSIKFTELSLEYENCFLLGEIKEQIENFEEFSFDHPLYILYSSGTTGKPKCIVHRAGGVLIEHIKEWGLHVEVSSDDTAFYQTTCGWMMWNWLVSVLYFGTKIVLYDGFALLDDGKFFLELVKESKITIFGTNAKFISLIEKNYQNKDFSEYFSSVKTILSTGSVLSPESFEYVYNYWKKDVCLSSIAGGTDIVGCFALGSPTLLVMKGFLQCRSLGLAVDCFNENGTSITNQQGELVCKAPFPNMPLKFWNDQDNQKYKNSYFNKFEGIWCHGDLVLINTDGQLQYFGRSDTVLNPGGVRIGSAEIYNQVETIPEIEESVVIGKRSIDNSDEELILFVKLKINYQLSDDLIQNIKNTIRKNCSGYHVPKYIYEVKDIPKTRSGKIVESAIRSLIEGKSINNIEAIANPEAFEYFKNLKNE